MWYRIGKEYKFGYVTEPSYIVYNSNIPRMSSQLKQITKGKKVLFEKHKLDFSDQSKYLSDLYYELAYESLSYCLKVSFLRNLIKSIKLNVKKVQGIFKIPMHLLQVGYKQKLIDNECRKILKKV